MVRAQVAEHNEARGCSVGKERGLQVERCGSKVA